MAWHAQSRHPRGPCWRAYRRRQLDLNGPALPLCGRESEIVVCCLCPSLSAVAVVRRLLQASVACHRDMYLVPLSISALSNDTIPCDVGGALTAGEEKVEVAVGRREVPLARILRRKSVGICGRLVARTHMCAFLPSNLPSRHHP